MSENLMEALHKAQEAMKPFFDERRAIEAEKCPPLRAELTELGVTLDCIGGNCPVQAEGSFDDKRFYFRARGDAWRLHIWTGTEDYLGTENPDEWVSEGEYGSGFDAGWMHNHEALALIVDGISRFKASPTKDGASHG